MRRLPGVVALIVWVVLLCVVLTGCGDDSTATGDGQEASTTTAAPADPGPAYYRSPGVVPDGNPGDVVEESPIPLKDLDGEGHRITYVSTTPRGDLVHLTGVVIVPAGEPPASGRPVAVWAHPTVGVGTDCAPSLDEPFALDGAQSLLDAGFVVVAPDYDGLGSAGTHPYLVGQSEARSVLDIARAGRAWGGNDVVVVWGHSQGGHAALWTRSIAEDYAPDLDLRATAAAAPPTDLATFLDPGFEDPRILPITAQTALAWSVVYPEVDLTVLATDAAVAVAAVLVDSCIVDIAALTADVQADAVWAPGAAEAADWRALIAYNSVDPARGTGPVFVSHGGDDVVVPIVGTEELVAALCAREEPVVYRTDATWTHGTSYEEVRDEMFAWLAAATSSPPASEC